MSIRKPLRPAAQTTGGFLVTFKEGTSTDEKMSILGGTTDSQVESLSLNDSAEKFMAFSAEDPDKSVLFDDLNMGATSQGFFDKDVGGNTFNALNVRGEKAAKTFNEHDKVQHVRPEYIMHALWNFHDQEERTWGLDATRVTESPYDGSGIKIAVLDTGIDINHPDNLSRNMVYTSFVPGEEAQDGHGHGTHCAGTATGGVATQLQIPVRYGVANNAELYAAKVLSNSGSGNESWVILGMLWAIRSGCSVISMSLGRAVADGEAPDPEYERIGQFALDNGCLIVAAAGNESARQQGYIAPVGSPGNSPSIMAVAAINERLRVADFSCGTINRNGGEVNIAAPGMQVFSSVPAPKLYDSWPGTSMATPHVAGIAALWAQKDPALRGQALWDALQNSARTIKGVSRRDVGAGLVQVPTA